MKGRRHSHGLRRRCPQCKKLRRFYEPGEDRSPRGTARENSRVAAARTRPGFGPRRRGWSKIAGVMVFDYGVAQRESRAGWKKIDGRWVCGWCNGARRKTGLVGKEHA